MGRVRDDAPRQRVLHKRALAHAPHATASGLGRPRPPRRTHGAVAPLRSIARVRMDPPLQWRKK
eukprot:NODE_7740_length_423_cov_473.649457.p5 GENE.NODE_7740_length_423_cov_473.649457~~NODE_7740_length_423_cov_473.649457.p5  ORF type:complete len:64 (-),score=1.43 NODE_7740_length_423_cov_473.649457:120-311(-)